MKTGHLKLFTQRRKKGKNEKSEQNLMDLWDVSKRTNTHFMRVLREEEREERTQLIC